MNVDRRLLIEFMPGVIFLLINAIWGLAPATLAALGGTLLAMLMRYQIDGQLPYLAIATVILSATLLLVSIILNDENFIKIRSTISGIAFAIILFVGSMFRPSLLERSLGYRLLILQPGWRVMHFAWGSLALTFAVLNELVWRNTSTDVWVLYGTVFGPIALGLYWSATWVVCWYYWGEDDDED